MSLILQASREGLSGSVDPSLVLCIVCAALRFFILHGNDVLIVVFLRRIRQVLTVRQIASWGY